MTDKKANKIGRGFTSNLDNIDYEPITDYMPPVILEDTFTPLAMDWNADYQVKFKESARASRLTLGQVYNSKKVEALGEYLISKNLISPAHYNLLLPIMHMYVLGELKNLKKPLRVNANHPVSIAMMLDDMIPLNSCKINISELGLYVYMDVLVHLMNVPEIIHDPCPHEGITFNHLHRYSNSDMRSEFIEHFTEEVNRELTVITASGNDDMGEIVTMEISEFTAQEPLHFLRAKCPTGKVILTEIPSTIHSPSDAQRWVAGLGEEDTFKSMPLVRM